MGSLDRIPVLWGSHKGFWKFFAFKHINGSSSWNALTQGKYLAELLDGVWGDNLDIDTLAAHSGLDPRHIARTVEAYRIVKQTKTDGEVTDGDKDAVVFLRKALEYGNIRAFVGIPNIKARVEKNPLDENNVPKARELIEWLVGGHDANQPSILGDQGLDTSLGQLDEILAEEPGIACLRKCRDIGHALEEMTPLSEHITSELERNAASLQTTIELIDEDYRYDEAHQKLAGSLANLADELYDLVDQRRRRSTKATRMTAEGL